MPWSLELGARPEVAAQPASAPLVNKILLAITAAAVVISLGFGGWYAYSTQHRAAELAAAPADTDQRAALLSAPDARLVPSTLDGAPVSYVVSKQQDRALFIGDDLPAPATGQVYQLWLISGGKAVSAGVLNEGGTVSDGSPGGWPTPTTWPSPSSRPRPGPHPTQDPISQVRV